ncbi:MAG: SBBP repeat-containing protein [Vicinamibacterales bacterium]
MPRRAVLSVLAIGVVLAAGTVWRTLTAPLTTRPQPVVASDADSPFEPDVLARLPLLFERVDGTADTFVARSVGYAVSVDGATMRFDVSRPEPRTVRATVAGAQRPPGRVHTTDSGGKKTYLLGTQPEEWQRERPLYSRVQFEDVYPGIDLAYYGHGRSLEYDFVVQPEANPSTIALVFDATTPLALSPEGDLVIGHVTDGLVFKRPLAYQLVDGGARRTVEAAYVLDDSAGSVRFEVGDYDPSRPVVIDPVLASLTPLGGADREDGVGVGLDSAGNVYVTGTTFSTNYPVVAPGTNGVHGRGDVFVTKLPSHGSGLLWSTVIGGDGAEEVHGIAVDGAGSSYVTGTTTSTNFPVVNAAQGSNAGGRDGFLLKLSPNGGTLLYSTYVGGQEIDEANGVAVDAAGNAYVVGTTFSSNFPVASSRQSALGGGTDAFLTKFAPAGGFVFSTYHGGSRSDEGRGVIVDGSGSAIVVGTTLSTDFPTASPTQATNHGDADAFVSRFSATGTSLVFSTYLGGASTDSAAAVALDTGNRVCVVGTTRSSDFPVTGPYTAIKGDYDGFLTIIEPSLAISGSTFIGGTASDRLRGIRADSQNRLFVVGQTASGDLPVAGGLQPAFAGSRDAFVAMFGLTGGGLVNGWTTYYGTANDEDGQGLAVDAAGSVVVVGTMEYGSGNPGGAADAYVLRLSNGDPTTDADGDGMPNEWELRFDLDPSVNDANGDLDGDGVSNLDEYRAGTHPNGRFTRYLAEGATSAFFATSLTMANPNAGRATVLFRFLRTDGTVTTELVSVPGQSRATLDVAKVPTMANAEFSTIIESNVAVVVDRTMMWDTTSFYGSHAETSVEQPALTWYLAEGATSGNFDLFYLVQNPGATAAQVEVTYLLPTPRAPVVKTYTIAARSRFNIWVDKEDTRLAATDVSAKIVSKNNQPILVERAMYLRAGGVTFGAGHASAAVTTPATSWFLAEGATGSYFDLFVLVANPGTNDAAVRATYLLPDGTSFSKDYAVRAQSRFNIWVDQEDPRLQDTAVSTIVESTNGTPIIVERAMWWPGPTANSWQEAHNSFGSTVTGTRWALADGERGGPRSTETFVLIANTSSTAGQVKVTVEFEDDASSLEKTFTVPARSRYNVQMAIDFPETTGRRFATVVESLGVPKAQIVVERAMYSNAGSTRWAAGTNALATRLAP